MHKIVLTVFLFKWSILYGSRLLLEEGFYFKRLGFQHVSPIMEIMELYSNSGFPYGKSCIGQGPLDHLHLARCPSVVKLSAVQNVYTSKLALMVRISPPVSSLIEDWDHLTQVDIQTLCMLLPVLFGGMILCDRSMLEIFSGAPTIYEPRITNFTVSVGSCSMISNL